VESAYTVNEADDTGLPLCAELRDGILERSVTVMLNSMDGSATTLGKHETKLCQGKVGYMSYDFLPSHAISNLSYHNGNGVIMIYILVDDLTQRVHCLKNSQFSRLPKNEGNCTHKHATLYSIHPM